MRAHFYLGLLAFSLLLASTAVPATAMSGVPTIVKNHVALKSYARSLDKLGPVKSQDTIDYDDMLDI